jgi:DNA-directed RNA polymerase subunit RPC12/RpoP
VAELVCYTCPKCGRSVTELHGPLMSDMGWEKGAERERRRLFMRGLRDRLRGIKRDMPEKAQLDDPLPELHGDENIRCRRCGLEMNPTRLALLD